MSFNQQSYILFIQPYRITVKRYIMYEIEIDTLDISLYKRYMAGKITLWDVALELNKCGWTTFVDKDYAAKMIASIDLARK